MKFPSIRNWLARKLNPVAGLIFPPGGQPISPRERFDQFAEEGFKAESTVYACISKIAKASAGVPVIVMRRQRNGAVTKITDHAFLKLIRRPNPFQSWASYFEAFIAFKLIAGNSYTLSVGPERGRPRELWNLRPDRIKVIPHAINFVAGYEYNSGGRKKNFENGEVLHVKMFNPTDDYLGLSPVQVASLPIDKSLLADQWNASSLKNLAVPPGVLTVKESLEEEDFQEVQKQFREKYGGAGNAGKPLFLSGGDFNWQQMALTAKDMDWIKGKQVSAKQVAQIFDVPGEIIGLTDSTFENRREAKKAFYSENVIPTVLKVLMEFNVWLAPRFGPDLFLDINRDDVDALQEDQQKKWKRIDDSAELTVNEKRQEKGFDVIDGADVIMVPANLIPLDVATGAPENQQADKTLPLLEGGRGDLEIKIIDLPTKTARRREILQIIKLRGNFENDLNRRAQKQFSAEAGFVIDAFKNHLTLDGALSAIAGQFESWQEMFFNHYKKVMQAFGERTLNGFKSCCHYPGGYLRPESACARQGREGPPVIYSLKADELFQAEFKIDPESANDLFIIEARRIAQRVAGEKIKEISATTKKRVGNVIEDGIAKGLPLAEISQNIEAIYEGFAAGRALTIARTETLSAQNKGSLESVRVLQSNNLQKGWLWSGVSRGDHAAVDGLFIPLGDTFSVGSSNLDHPGDPNGAPEDIINCSCSMDYKRG